MTDPAYVAGQCNIGGAEVTRRRTVGWIGLAATVLLLGVLFWAGVNPWWRLTAFVPAFLSASGFLQAHFRFCSGFARAGLFNFGPLGERQHVADEASRRKDLQRGNQINLYAAAIGAAVAIVSVFV